MFAGVRSSPTARGESLCWIHDGRQDRFPKRPAKGGSWSAVGGAVGEGIYGTPGANWQELFDLISRPCILREVAGLPRPNFMGPSAAVRRGQPRSCQDAGLFTRFSLGATWGPLNACQGNRKVARRDPSRGPECRVLSGTHDGQRPGVVAEASNIVAHRSRNFGEQESVPSLIGLRHLDGMPCLEIATR